MDDMANTSDTSTTTAPPASEESGRNANRSTTPGSEGFKEFIGSGWADRDETLPPAREQAAFAAARRATVSAAFTGVRLIVPAGDMKQRANDTDYPFRAHSAFAHLTGWGSDSEPGAVLVLEPNAGGHTATVYFRERAGRDSEEFYANPAIGEFWIGPRPSLAHVAADLAIETRGLEDFDRVLASVDTSTLVLREADAAITERVDHARIRFAAEEALSTNAADAPFSLEVNGDHDADGELARVLSELRLVKDEFEVAEMRAAIDATQRGFTEVLEELPRITAEVRGERVIEGVFATRARLDGNDVGYG
jgi:Xaa-Pro aminopeptidase